MKPIYLLLLLLLAGCASKKPAVEGKLIGTMSIYKTDKGCMVVSDQSGDRMIINFHAYQIFTTKPKEEE